MTNVTAARPRLILHVGPGKTGSSAIQKWLLDRSDQLAADGYFYPAPHHPDKFEGNCIDFEAMLRRPMKIGSADDFRAVNDLLSSYGSELTSRNCHTLLISNENLCNIGKEKLRILKSVAEQKFDLKIVIVVREPYSWFWSAWGQCIKRAGLAEGFPEFVERNIGDYEKIYANYLDIFDDVSLLAYSRSSLLTDFARAAGLQYDGHGGEANGGETVNRSMTRGELDVLLCVNAICRDAATSMAISDLMIRQNPEAKAYVAIDVAVLALVEKGTYGIVQRLRTLLPGCAQLPVAPTDAMPSGQDAVVQMDRRLFEHILGLVRSSNASERRFALLRHMMAVPPAEKHYGMKLPPDFSAVDYLVLNQDVLRADIDPIDHYLNYGRHEGRPYTRNMGTEPVAPASRSPVSPISGSAKTGIQQSG